MRELEELLNFELDELYVRYHGSSRKTEINYKDQLDKIPISEIESYLRRKKLENINGLSTT